MAKKQEEQTIDGQGKTLVSRPFAKWGLDWRMAYIQGWKDVYYHWGDDIAEYHADYDKWPNHLQYAYENGRLQAANVRAAGISCASWRKVSDIPDEIDIAMYIAKEKTGTPFPQYRADGGT